MAEVHNMAALLAVLLVPCLQHLLSIRSILDVLSTLVFALTTAWRQQCLELPYRSLSVLETMPGAVPLTDYLSYKRHLDLPSTSSSSPSLLHTGPVSLESLEKPYGIPAFC